MKVLTMIEVFCMLGGASTLHGAGTQTWSGSTVGSEEEEERRAGAEKSMAGAENKVIRQSARAGWRDPNTCGQAERGRRAPWLLNPAAPAGSLSIRGLLSDLVLHTLLWQHRCRDAPGTTAFTSLLHNQNRLLNRPHAH